MTAFYCVLIIAMATWIARLTNELQATKAALESAQDTAIEALENYK